MVDKLMNLPGCQDFLGVPVSPVVVKTVTVNMLSTKYMAAPKTIVQPTFSKTNTIRDVKYTISSLPHIRS